MSLGRVGRALGVLDLVGECLRLAHQPIEAGLRVGARRVVGRLLQRALQRADLLAEQLLLVAQLVEGRLRLALRRRRPTRGRR